MKTWLRTDSYKLNKIGPRTEPCGAPHVASGPSLKLTTNVFIMSHLCEKKCTWQKLSFQTNSDMEWNVTLTKK